MRRIASQVLMVLRIKTASVIKGTSEYAKEYYTMAAAGVERRVREAK